MGRFNGGYVAGEPLPAVEGLGPGGLRSWVSASRGWAAAGAVSRRTPASLGVRAVPDLDAVMRLLLDAERMLDQIDRLPQTFVHRDATPGNVLVRATADGNELFVLIDWMLAGRGALGEDAAGIVGATAWQLLTEPRDARALEERVLTGYLAGLRDAGWNGDDRLVRFGYAATLALRFAPLILAWVPELDDTSKSDWFVRKFARPAADVADAWGEMLPFLLARGQEARSLADDLGFD
jgi:hypothetical protein